jgi:hypothetical protein
MPPNPFEEQNAFYNVDIDRRRLKTLEKFGFPLTGLMP